jgi:DNA-binding transcriptional MerR regulator
MSPLTQTDLIKEADRRAAEVHGAAFDERQLTERTVRFYRAQAILDPPSGWQGNRPLFDERHVYQLLAVRVLQSAGWSLQQIRDWLRTADGMALERLVTSPGSIAKTVPPSVPPKSRTGDERQRHWKRTAAASDLRASALVHDDTVETLDTVRVAPGVYVMVDRHAAGNLSPEEVAAAARRINRLLHELEE